MNNDGKKRTAYELLGLAAFGQKELIELDESLSSVSQKSWDQLARDAVYAGYVERQAKDVATLRSDEKRSIPTDFDYSVIDGLSHELRSKLERVRPANLGQAGRIDGMTPAALTLLLAKLRQSERRTSAS